MANDTTRARIRAVVAPLYDETQRETGDEEELIRPGVRRDSDEGRFMTECCACGALYLDSRVPNSCRTCGSQEFEAV